jgi:NAD(P)-dependent dehydrogenase (short-subunit alcohol dehydrogenase family)
MEKEQKEATGGNKHRLLPGPTVPLQSHHNKIPVRPSPTSNHPYSIMRTAVITGGNSGMGKAVATALAGKGFRTIIHGRDQAKTNEAVEEIKSKSGNTNVEGIVADISVIAGMKQLAGEIKRKTNSIEVLVLSTGVILPNHIVTSDGLEAGFAIQYLSRFTVVQHLMDELKTGRARIVMVGAPLLKGATIFFDDIAMKGNFTMMKALAQEMLANHLFTQEFARRNPSSDVVMNIVHPGVAKTGIMRETNFFFRLMVTLFGKSPDAAAKNLIYLGTDPSVNFSGYFLTKPGKPKVMAKIEQDPGMAERLWSLSLQLIK